MSAATKGGRAEARLLTPEERHATEVRRVADMPGSWELTKSRTLGDPHWVARQTLTERDEEGEYEVQQYESTDITFGRLLRRISIRNRDNQEARRG